MKKTDDQLFGVNASTTRVREIFAGLVSGHLATAEYCYEAGPRQVSDWPSLGHC